MVVVVLGRWWWLIVVVVVLCWCEGAVAEGGGTCYPPGGVAGIVVATIIVTLVVAGLGAGLAWKYWWTPRQKDEGRNAGTRRSETQQQQQKNPADFAFDNPYFRNNQEGDEQDAGRNKPCLNNKNSLRSSKQLSEASAKAKKARGGKNHFGFGGGKKKAQDDSCIAAVEPERAFVSLRGHDFTGLGFNICGNMRDGILVKDVLHRGPASESGLIKAGDKIVNVTVSFTNIVYEDALTILSYASPYDVQLEIERVPAAAAAPKRLASCSFNNSGQKLFHPLYRSQSIDDLTQIDGGGGNGGTFPSHGGGPRRSHSVGVAAHKLAAHFKGKEGEEKATTSLVLSATGSLNEKMLANVMTDSKGLQWEKRFEDTLDSDQDSPKDNNGSISIKKDSSKASYLDYPHSKLQQEMRTESPASTRNRRLEGSIRKTVVEVSNRDQDQTRSSLSKSRKGVLKRDEDNDSDVSRDSLEVSHRGYVKRNVKVSSSSNLESQNKDERSHISESPRQMFLKKAMETEEPVTKGGIYVKDRSKSSRVHSNSLSSNEEPVQDTTPTSYYKSRQESVENDNSSYFKSRQESVDQGSLRAKSSTTNVFSTSSYVDRQKPSGSEGFVVSKIVVNGGVADDQKRAMVQPLGPSQTEDRSQPKFAKKTATAAGGMFTQINPFQVSSSKARGQWMGGQVNGSAEQSEFHQGRNSGYTGPKLSLKDSAIKHRQF